MLHSNEDISREVAQKATSAVWGWVVGRFMATTAALVAYIVFFRFLVAPYLVTQSTKLTVWQALLYPIAYASDYFFGTSFVKYVHSIRFRLFGWKSPGASERDIGGINRERRVGRRGLIKRIEDAGR